MSGNVKVWSLRVGGDVKVWGLHVGGNVKVWGLRVPDLARSAVDHRQDNRNVVRKRISTRCYFTPTGAYESKFININLYSEKI